MIDVTIGIDIGTTYTKAVARTEDGTVIAINRIRSQQFNNQDSTSLLKANKWWECCKYILIGLLNSNTLNKLHIKSICVSAIAPTLTVFDETQPDEAYAILYSSLKELKDGVSLSQSDPQLTEQRLEVLRNVACKANFNKPCISDLIGYINWRLTDALTMNSITLAETGMFGGERDCDQFSVVDKIVPRLVAPGMQIGEISVSSAKELGIKPGIPVCGGCPDTLSSIVGAGLVQASEVMLYLGTFGSFMRLEADVDTLLNVPNCRSHPFSWLLSVPGFGPKIENLSHRWFASEAEANRLQMLDQNAIKTLAGAGGTLFLVPRWKDGMTTVGSYQFVADRNGEIGNIQKQARAALESIAYAIIALDIHSNDVIKVSGGGARSHTWLDILSIVLNCDVQTRHMAWEATGTADIAAGLVWKSVKPKRTHYTAQKYHDVSREDIEDNSQRMKEYYYERNWL